MENDIREMQVHTEEDVDVIHWSGPPSTGSGHHSPRLMASYGLPWTSGKRSVGVFSASRMVEAGGIEPPSESVTPSRTTCLAANLISSLKRPAAGFSGTSRFKSRPHLLRQENQPIPLIDALSDPVGENR